MNTTVFSPRAILFDLDGTLLDTVADLAAAANAMMVELGYAQRTEEEIHRFVGRGLVNLIARCLTNDDETQAPDAQQLEQARAVFYRHYHLSNGQAARCYEGIIPLLQSLRAKGLRLAVVTNKVTEFTVPLLIKTGLNSFFETVVCGDTLAVKKPQPDMLQYACKHLGVSTDEALMIGDSANDALAARAAGIPVLLVRWGYSEGVPVEQIECDGLLEQAADLTQWLH